MDTSFPEPIIAASKLKVPVYKPSLTKLESAHLHKAFSSTWISGNGSYLQRFEQLFSRAMGSKYATATNSGTSALHVGYRLLNIQRGDEVILPAFTMISTATPLIELGAIPIFIDIDAYWQINTSLIEKYISSRTKAIVGVHIYGHPCNIDGIEHLAKKYHLRTLYDAAEAHGALYKNKKLGSFGDVVCYSLYANKIVTTGEGGVVTVNDANMHTKSKRLIDEYFSPKMHFWHEDYGYSYRLSNILASIGVAQLQRMPTIIRKKQSVNAMYKSILAHHDSIICMPEADYAKSVYWMNAVSINNISLRQLHTIRTYMAGKGIETRSAFIPMTVQPAFKNYNRQSAPNAERLAHRTLLLPSFPDLTKKQITLTCEALISAVAKVHS